MARKPNYRRHSTRDLGFVEHDKKRTYFSGPYGSPESLAEYSEFLRTHGFIVSSNVGQKIEGAVKLSLLSDLYLEHAKATYPTGRGSHSANIANALRLVGTFFTEHELAVNCTPLRVKAFQKHLADQEKSIRYVNDTLAHFRAMFKWGASEELLPVATYQSILTVPGLRLGRSKAKDTKPRKPVDPKHVAATLPKLPPTVRAMVQVQQLTGARSQSVCHARVGQFDCTQQPWIWKPKHKTEYRGHVLTLFVGKRAQKIISPLMKGKSPDAYVFQPKNKAGNRSPKYKSFYETGTYRNAIRRAAKKAGVPHWFPHLLRHTLGTDVRNRFGVEAAQAVLGHVDLNATQLYAQKQLALAKMVMQKMG